MAAAERIRGTREWAVANIDCCTGCSNNCLYCYARYDAVEKRKTVRAAEWITPVVRHEDIEKSYPTYPGRVMFPTTHDIFPENLDSCIKVIKQLLKSENKVLIVSKPRLECIRKMCDRLEKAKENILFRFTITAMNDEILSFWEPEAPDYSERRSSLEYAHARDFKTSVSVEPMLETENVVEMVLDLLPYVNHSIWLGKMNKIAKRVVCDSKETKQAVARIRYGQSDKKIRDIYRQLKDNQLVRWKESIKEIVGLDLAQEAGLDI